MNPLQQIQDSHKVYGLAGVNLSLTGVQTWLTRAQPVLGVILIVAQIIVAIVTIVYTVRQILKKKSE